MDGNNILYRAFYAIPILTTSEGQPTNAVFGYIRTLLKILSEHIAEYIAVAFDSPVPTFRHQRYEGYKAHRPPTPESLKPQVAIAKELTDALGIRMLEVPGYEADDLIATLAKRAEPEVEEVLIVTGDMDVLQLVSDKVKVLETGRGTGEPKVYDRKEVERRLGVPPEKVLDFRALCGDSSDNVPGVPGVGPKTALRLLSQFESVEEMLSGLERVESESLRRSLAENAEKLKMWLELLRLRREAPIKVDLEELRRREPHADRLVLLLSRLEFRTLASELAKLLKHKVLKPKMERVQTEEQFERFLQRAREEPVWAVSLLARYEENDKLPTPLAIAVAFEDKVYHVPIWEGVEVGATPSQEEKELSLFSAVPTEAQRKAEEREKKFLSLICDGREVVTHSAKAFYQLCEGRGHGRPNVSFDSEIAAYLLNPGRGKYPLDELLQENFTLTLPEGSLWERLCAEAEAVRLLRPKLEGMLKASQRLYHLFREVEMPLVRALALMELRGIAISRAHLKGLSQKFSQFLGQLEREIHRMAEEPFNINSPKQLHYILFDKLGLKGTKRTKRGYSTEASVLEALSKEHPIAGKILEFREFQKLKSTYVEALPKLISRRTSLIHTTFHQTGTATGRLSSSDPNLQNIPARGKFGPEIRRAFVPKREGQFLLSCDYSQIELRILAHFSKDAGLVDAFRRGEDIHTRTACEIFGISKEEVSPDQRRMAKVVNFGIVYGISGPGLASRLGISEEEGRRLIEEYFKRHPGVREYINWAIEEARKKSYVETLFGRRRYLPDINSPARQLRENAERMAINTPIQGTAADIIKVAMVRLTEDVELTRLGVGILIQVHDELVFEVERLKVLESARRIKERMEEVANLAVPLVVECKAGPNWVDMEELRV